MTLHRRDCKTIETPEGIGQVLKEGKLVAKVNYNLSVEMLEIYAKSFGIPKETRLERKSVTGKISVLDGNIPLADSAAGVSGPFTLVLQDGRKVDFYIDSCSTKPDPVSKEYAIQGSGNRL